jgi:hypothetical protein
MTEPNNTPNEPSDQESLDDVLRGLSAEGSEEDQSLDDILASLSEGEPTEDTLVTQETLETDDLLAPGINEAGPEQGVNEIAAESVFSGTDEPDEASSFDSLAPSQSLEELPFDAAGDTLAAFTNAADVTEPEQGVDEPWRAESQTVESISEASAELETPLEPAIPEVDQSTSFEIADTSTPIVDPQSEVSPFDPLPTSHPADEAAFETSADDTLESAFTDAAEVTDPSSDWVDEPFSTEPLVESTLESNAESETFPESPSPSVDAVEEADPFEVAGIEDRAVPSPFDSPVTSQAEEAVSPFSEPADVVEPAFTRFTEADDISAEAQSLDQPAEPADAEFESASAVEEADPFEVAGIEDRAVPSPFDPPVASQSEEPVSPFSEPDRDVVEPAFTSFTEADDIPADDSFVDAQSLDQPAAEPADAEFGSADASVDEPQATEDLWTLASEPTPSVPDVPELSTFENESSLTPSDTPGGPTEFEVAAFDEPQAPIDEPVTREELELTASDPDFSGPELPSLPPLAQPAFSEPAESLSQAFIDTPTGINSDSEAQPLTLATLLGRPRHRWLVPFGFILIVILFGAIVLGALRGNQNSDPAPDTQEQSSALDHTHRRSS